MCNRLIKDFLIVNKFFLKKPEKQFAYEFNFAKNRKLKIYIGDTVIYKEGNTDNLFIYNWIFLTGHRGKYKHCKTLLIEKIVDF